MQFDQTVTHNERFILRNKKGFQIANVYGTVVKKKRKCNENLS